MRHLTRDHGLWVGLGLVVAAAAVSPVLDRYAQSIAILLFLYIALGTAWNLLGGYAGQVSFGHAAFFGVGAYGIGLVTTRLHVSPWIGLLAGGLVALPVAFVVGAACFRLRGPYFSLAMLAVAEIFRHLALNWVDLTHGAVGVVVRPELFSGAGKLPYYLGALGLATSTVLVAHLVVRSRVGYFFIALRDSEEAAESLGVSTVRYKLVALLISAFFTALCGGYYASYVSFISPELVFSVDISAQMAFVPIVGGLGTVTGPIVGATVLSLLSELFRSTFKQANLLVYGMVLVAVVLFMPDGVVGEARRLVRVVRRRMRRGVARPEAPTKMLGT